MSLRHRHQLIQTYLYFTHHHYHRYHSCHGKRASKQALRAIRPTTPRTAITQRCPPGASRRMQATNYIKSVTTLGLLHRYHSTGEQMRGDKRQTFFFRSMNDVRNSQTQRAKKGRDISLCLKHSHPHCLTLIALPSYLSAACFICPRPPHREADGWLDSPAISGKNVVQLLQRSQLKRCLYACAQPSRLYLFTYAVRRRQYETTSVVRGLGKGTLRLETHINADTCQRFTPLKTVLDRSKIAIASREVFEVMRQIVKYTTILERLQTVIL
ncbi:hypothetical protein F5Y12DRAFT_653057 [Xylaria sp. FL1777]|nr:hypothetical protein F5Y12DRAFT_653057 [Xylaria sp. FL1777]